MTRPSNQSAVLAETTIDQKNKKKQKQKQKTKNKLDPYNNNSINERSYLKYK
jgi:hypothetical protein